MKSINFVKILSIQTINSCEIHLEFVSTKTLESLVRYQKYLNYVMLFLDFDTPTTYIFLVSVKYLLKVIFRLVDQLPVENIKQLVYYSCTIYLEYIHRLTRLVYLFSESKFRLQRKNYLKSCQARKMFVEWQALIQFT